MSVVERGIIFFYTEDAPRFATVVLNRAKASLIEVSSALELWIIRGIAKNKVMKAKILMSVTCSLKKAMIP